MSVVLTNIISFILVFGLMAISILSTKPEPVRVQCALWKDRHGKYKG